MKIGVIGGGSWGVTLAQVLVDNSHEVLVFDINENTVNSINSSHTHPFFDVKIDELIKASSSLEEVVDFSDTLLLSVPTKVMRSVLEQINSIAKTKKILINVAKGIEPETLKTVSQIALEVMSDKIEGFVTLTGPSHAEEVIVRKATALVSASTNEEVAKYVQKLFSNDKYIRVYTSSDVIGVELCGSVKNIIALICGVASGLGHGENARAALITRGLLEMRIVLEKLGGKKETIFGLTGVGDLIVTANSLNSRNFQAGLKIGRGEPVESVLSSSKMVVEGARSAISCHDLIVKDNMDLPIIQTTYDILYKGLDPKVALVQTLNRKLKSE